MSWIVKTTIKLGVLALAAVGAQRVVELVKPRLTSFRDETVPAVHDALDEANSVVRNTASNLRTDATAAVSNARDDLRPAAEELKQAVGKATDALVPDADGTESATGGITPSTTSTDVETEAGDIDGDGLCEIPSPGAGMADAGHS